MIIIWLLAYRIQRGPGLGLQQFAAAFSLSSSATTYKVEMGKQKYSFYFVEFYIKFIYLHIARLR